MRLFSLRFYLLFPYWTPKFKWSIARLVVVMNKHEMACVTLRLDYVLNI